jgi:hypothetical protein
MPIDRMVAGITVILLVLLDFIGLFNPMAKKVPQEKKVIEEVASKRNATISIGEIGEHRMDEVVEISCDVRNTGEANHSFPVNVQLSGAGIEEVLPFKRITLEKEKSEKVVFQYKVPDTAREGRVSVMASIWDRVDGTRPAQKYAQGKKDFNLVDGPPQISFLNLGLSAQIGERLNLRIKVSDDRGVRRVKIFYQLPGMATKKDVLMKRVSGNERDGVWVFVTDPSLQTGKFVFSVEAMDTKSQIATTEEYKIAIVTKK